MTQQSQHSGPCFEESPMAIMQHLYTQQIHTPQNLSCNRTERPYILTNETKSHNVTFLEETDIPSPLSLSC